MPSDRPERSRPRSRASAAWSARIRPHEPYDRPVNGPCAVPVCITRRARAHACTTVQPALSESVRVARRGACENTGAGPRAEQAPHEAREGRPVPLEAAGPFGRLLQEQAGGGHARAQSITGVCATPGARGSRVWPCIPSGPVTREPLARVHPYVSCVSVELYFLAFGEAGGGIQHVRAGLAMPQRQAACRRGPVGATSA